MIPGCGPRTSRKPDYGIGAPGAIRTLAITAAGLGLSSRIMPPMVVRGVNVRRLAGPILAAAGTVTSTLALSMLAYGLRGKLTFRDRLLAMIDWRGDERVLDIGTGHGLLLIGAAKHLTTGFAIGIDIEKSADLAADGSGKALHNAKLEGVRDKVDVQSADARRLGFADDSFDVVLCALCLHTIADKAGRTQACGEIARVLKPGGTALISDYVGTAQYVDALGAAGLIVERSRPYLRESLTVIRVVAATKPLAHTA